MLYRRSIVALVALLLAAWVGTTPVAAQTVVTNGSYVAGWNMVGGPLGANFSGAAALDAYGPNGYIAPDPSHPIACQGYWADFINPATVTLPAATGPTQACPLQPGWNLIGNPFSGKALLPAGTDGYYWNPDRDSYDIVQAIPPGGAVWIDSAYTGNLTLTFAGAATDSPTTLEIDFVSAGPFTIHVGDSIKLLLPFATPFVATADPRYLHLESAGTSGSLTCVGSGCQLQTDNRFWIWHAVSPGTTSIAVAPQCATAVPPCLAPEQEITIIILP